MTHNIEQARTRRVGNPVQFNVLGPVTVVDAREPLNTGGPKQRTVLAMLIANVGRPVSNDVIAEAVYGEASPERARRRVQVYVSTLRSIVGDVIVKDGGGWTLRVDRSQVDALRFEDLYESVRDSAETPPESAGQVLREALAFWRGRPYSDVESHGYLDAEISRLAELRVAVQAARIDADLESGRHADLIGEIEGLISEHPYLEQFRAQHMLALYRAGRQSEALRSFEEMRTLLVDELGVDPTRDLQELEQRILEQDDSLDLVPRKQIQKKAVLVADPGDPIELARLPSAEREELLSIAGLELRRALGESALLPAGTAAYAVFDTVGEAAAAAEAMTLRTDGAVMRMAIDFGDVEVSASGVSGVPVARASVLVSVAHRGQVLLSADAQQAVVRGDDGAGLRFESLGRFELAGIQDPTLVHQLLVGDPPPTFPPLDTDRTPVPLPDGGDRSVPGYELREPIGPGSLGTVYRAYQPSVGREVMVEMIGRTEASEPAFIRSFEADAQRLALLDHPNINPLLDYWRDPDGACLVYRYHRGGLLDHGSVEEPDRLIEQIGRALDHAHSYGVVHGSVRPDRVVLDESDNGYLMGFPLADVAPKSSPDHAAYIAPETLAGKAATEATDVFGLGVLVLELREGSVPGDSPLRPESPVIARAVSEDPSDRYQSVATFLAELYPGGDEPRERFTKTRNPYKGLAAFHENDAGDFFGRGAVVEELVRALTEDRFLAVVGPSGIGKSSVVRAGLIPVLRHGAIDRSDDWVITDMLPGPRPFLELERALERVAVDLPADVRELFAERDANALAGLGRVLPDRSELLLVIDQFEELFTMTDEKVASAFLDLLVNAVELNQARIVVTLRADFLDRPLLFSEFGELLRESMIGLRSPNPVELGEAITGPARGVGVDVDTALVERLVSDVHDRPGGLPLLQFALVELFDSRDSDLMTLDSHEEIGGVTGSVARRAEEVYQRLDSHQQSTIKQVFLRLVTVIDDAAPTRRRVRVTDLDDLNAEQAIDAFAANRMLVFDNDPDTRTPTVEVAHEALLTQWPRLLGWIEATREDLTLARRLEEAILDWEESERDDEYLLTGGRLAQHVAWTGSTSLVLTDRETSYLETSASLEERELSRRRRRRRWITAGFGVAAAVATAFAMTAAQSAADAEAEALAAGAVVALETDPELALLLAVEATQANPSQAALAAIRQGLQSDRSMMTIPSPEMSDGAFTTVDPAGESVALVGGDTATVEMWKVGATEETWQVTLSEDVHAAFRGWSHLWFSEDGRSVYVPLSFGGSNSSPASPDQGLYELDAETGEVVRFLPFPCLGRAMPAGRHFAAPDGLWAFDWGGQVDGGSCHLYQGEPGAGVVDIDEGEILFRTELSPGRPPTLSGDGGYLASSSEFHVDNEWQYGQRVFDTSTGEIVLETDFPAGGSVLSRDGTRILLGQSPTFLYDVESNSRLQSYQGDFVRVFFSPDETRVIGVGADGIRIFDTQDGTELMHLRVPSFRVRSAATDLAGNVLVSSARDATVWDIAEPARGDLEPLEVEHLSESRFPPGAISASSEFMVVHRDRIKQTINSEPKPHRMDTIRLEDGSTVRTEEVWGGRLGPDDVLFVIPVRETGVTAPSGAGGAVRIGAPRLVDAGTRQLIRELEDCDWYWTGEFVEPEPARECGRDLAPNYTTIEFSADGSAVLAATWFGEVTVWDTASGKVVRHLDPTWSRDLINRNRWGSALSPDGSLMINFYSQEEAMALLAGEADDAPFHVIDVATGEEVASVRETPLGWINDFEFDPASGMVIGMSGDLVLIDPSTWALTVLRRSQTSVLNQFAIAPGGGLVATVGGDEFVAVWDIDTRSLVAEVPIVGWIGEGLRGIAFEDDSTLIIAPEAGDQLLRFSLDTEVLLERALVSLDRGFRTEECATYNIDPCPTLKEMKDRS